MFYIKMSHLAGNSELHIIPNFENPDNCMKTSTNMSIRYAKENDREKRKRRRERKRKL